MYAKNLFKRNCYRKVAKDVENCMLFLDNSLEHTQSLSLHSQNDVPRTSPPLTEAMAATLCNFSSNSDCGNDEPNGNLPSCSGARIKEPEIEGVLPVSNVSIYNFKESFESQLGQWATEENIALASLGKLLRILQTCSDKELKNLPVDPRTLLRTPKNTDCKLLGSGNYFYFGIQNTINILFAKFTLNPELINNIEIAVNVDGLPLHKSTGNSFWPILCLIKSIEVLNKEVFMVALFQGPNKPPANELIFDFVSECTNLVNNGIKIENFIIPFKVKMIICDMPAKSYILSVKGHSGYFSCTKCCTEGTIYEGIVCFDELNCAKRNDVNFRNKTQEEHHTGNTILQNIPKFDMIEDIPLDYMHCILLGVTKRMFCQKKYGLIFGKPPFKLPAQKVLLLNKKLKYLKKFIPFEFSRRKTRDINEIKRYKATEFRLLLLYTGPIVLKNVVSKKIYHLFLMLSIATLILASKEFSVNESLVGFAISLQEHFIMNCRKVYSLGFVSLNVHSLLHIGDCVNRFGSLDNFSSFLFENYMQQIKKKIRKSSQPIQQIIKRISEDNNFISPMEVKPFTVHFSLQHNNGPLLPGLTSPQFKKYIEKDFLINANKLADSFVQLNDNTIVEVKNFATNSNGNVNFIGFLYESNNDFFSKPCPSSFVNVSMICKKCIELKSWEVSRIRKKVVVLPFEGKLVCFPLLHL